MSKDTIDIFSGMAFQETLEDAFRVLSKGAGYITARTPEHPVLFLIRSEFNLGLRWIQVEETRPSPGPVGYTGSPEEVAEATRRSRALGGLGNVHLIAVRPFFAMSDNALANWLCNIEIVEVVDLKAETGK